ncbi:MAG: TonB-dependent receptor [Leadbetterella sp.]
MRKKITLLVFTFCSTFAVFSQTKLNINLKDPRTNLGVPNAQVEVLETNKVYVSDSIGIVRMEDLPLYIFTIKISKQGYETHIIKQLKGDTHRPLLLEVELTSHTKDLEQIVISGQSKSPFKSLSGTKSIELEEVMRLPVTFYDPARLAQSFAGVANTNDQSNEMSVRGTSPQNVVWTLEGVEIVNPNHLSNAGTFSDNATQSSGGTNALSAQMLGNMALHTGAFSPELSNSIGGIMDVSFRKGATERHAKTIQIGLIGLDLALEGPMNKKKTASYLINYRYSFTGILAAMGVSFGGEKIRFQDLGFNFSLPIHKRAELKIFGVGGNSSNYFTPPTEEKDILTEKDQREITFTSQMGIIGLKYNFRMSDHWRLDYTNVGSIVENTRNQFEILNPLLINNNENTMSKWSQMLKTTYQNHPNLSYSVGISHLVLSNTGKSTDIIPTTPLALSENITRFFAKVNVHNWNKFNAQIGVNYLYSLNNSVRFWEPRASLQYKASNRLHFQGSAGINSQFNYLATSNSYSPNLLFTYAYTLGLNLYSKNQASQFTLEGFYNGIFEQYQIITGDYYHSLNTMNSLYNSSFYGYNSNAITGKNYGIEIGYKYFVKKGLYLISNLTLFKSLFVGPDNEFHSTRYDREFLYNFTAGKEWIKKSNKTWGLNTRINYMGGLRDYVINKNESRIIQETFYDLSTPLLSKNPNYFRADLRVYRRKQKGKTARTWSLDIQNLTNQENLGFNYFDSYKNEIVAKNQLGLIPVLNYRIEF